jgi:hypothetical protein
LRKRAFNEGGFKFLAQQLSDEVKKALEWKKRQGMQGSVIKNEFK